MKRYGSSKSHFIETKLIVEIEKLRASGKSYKDISKELSWKFQRHFSVGLIFKKSKKKTA